jgi:hypothetical protein
MENGVTLNFHSFSVGAGERNSLKIVSVVSAFAAANGRKQSDSKSTFDSRLLNCIILILNIVALQKTVWDSQ